MRYKHAFRPFHVAAALALFLLSACITFRGGVENPHPGAQPGLEIMVTDVYQGVGDGNIESVPLPVDSAYITVEGCIKNVSGREQSVRWQDVFIITSDNALIFPVAVGYDQAEAFSWLLPMTEPIGGKHIDHKFYFFLIQSNELMRLGAYQSLGCNSASEQYKSLAFLFITQDDVAGQPFTLRFFEGAKQFEARRIIAIAPAVQWGAGLGVVLLISCVFGWILVRKKRMKTQASTVQEEIRDDHEES